MLLIRQTTDLISVCSEGKAVALPPHHDTLMYAIIVGCLAVTANHMLSVPAWAPLTAWSILTQLHEAVVLLLIPLIILSYQWRNWALELVEVDR